MRGTTITISTKKKHNLNHKSLQKVDSRNTGTYLGMPKPEGRGAEFYRYSRIDGVIVVCGVARVQ